jgi:hypothetical protein
LRSIRFESFDVACSREDGTGVTGGKTWGTGTGFIRRFGGEMSDDGEFGDRHMKKFGGKIFIANGGREDVFGMIGSRGKG